MAIILTIEPQPAGPTFARCEFTGTHAGPNGLPMDTNIYMYTCTREMRQSTRVTGSLRSQLVIIYHFIYLYINIYKNI